MFYLRATLIIQQYEAQYSITCKLAHMMTKQKLVRLNKSHSPIASLVAQNVTNEPNEKSPTDLAFATPQHIKDDEEERKVCQCQLCVPYVAKWHFFSPQYNPATTVALRIFLAWVAKIFTFYVHTSELKFNVQYKKVFFAILLLDYCGLQCITYVHQVGRSGKVGVMNNARFVQRPPCTTVYCTTTRLTLSFLLSSLSFLHTYDGYSPCASLPSSLPCYRLLIFDCGKISIRR